MKNIGTKTVVMDKAYNYTRMETDIKENSRKTLNVDMVDLIMFKEIVMKDIGHMG